MREIYGQSHSSSLTARLEGLSPLSPAYLLSSSLLPRPPLQAPTIFLHIFLWLFFPFLVLPWTTPLPSPRLPPLDPTLIFPLFLLLLLSSNSPFSCSWSPPSAFFLLPQFLILYSSSSSLTLPLFSPVLLLMLFFSSSSSSSSSFSTSSYCSSSLLHSSSFYSYSFIFFFCVLLSTLPKSWSQICSVSLWRAGDINSSTKKPTPSCLSAYLYVCLSECLPRYPSVCLTDCLSVGLPACLSSVMIRRMGR